MTLLDTPDAGRAQQWSKGAPRIATELSKPLTRAVVAQISDAPRSGPVSQNETSTARAAAKPASGHHMREGSTARWQRRGGALPWAPGLAAAVHTASQQLQLQYV